MLAIRNLKQLIKKTDKNGRLLLIETKTDDTVFILINLYNPNKETDQVITLNELNNILDSIDDLWEKETILGGNFLFDSKSRSIWWKSFF